MSISQSIILGIMQGIAEWLPISSSGHLVIAQEFFGLQNAMFFDIMLHIATIFVVFIVFWKDIKEILKALFKRDFRSEYGKLAIYVIIGSIPTGIIGFLFCDTFEKLFSNLWAVGGALMVTGILLLLTRKKHTYIIPRLTRHPENLKYSLPNLIPHQAQNDIEEYRELNGKSSFLIGIVQGIAIIPGISRSGSTISAGILMGINKEKAARFSFLLSIPAIIGAFLLEFNRLDMPTNSAQTARILTGMIAAMLAGYISLKLLLKIIKLEKFYLFGYYCIAVSAILINILLFVK
ncbi:MAG: undecaprenyl-diphosphate phosphatase [bacterium]